MQVGHSDLPQRIELACFRVVASPRLESITDPNEPKISQRPHATINQKSIFVFAGSKLLFTISFLEKFSNKKES